MSSIEKGEIVRFGEQQILAYRSGELDIPSSKELEQPSEAYLGTPVLQGAYGVVSFGLVVPHPEARPYYYYAGEGPAGDWDERGKDELDPAIANDPVRLSHFFNTSSGFAVIRTVAAPARVSERLLSDKFLGPALIDKCFLEETLPVGFDEERRLSLNDCMGWERWEKINAVYDRVLSNVAASSQEEFVPLDTNPSWHNYGLYGVVLDQVTQACRQTVANFDKVLALLAKDLPQLYDFEGKVMLPKPDSNLRELTE